MRKTISYRRTLDTEHGKFFIEPASNEFELYFGTTKIGRYKNQAMAQIEAEEMLGARDASQETLARASDLANWESQK